MTISCEPKRERKARTNCISVFRVSKTWSTGKIRNAESLTFPSAASSELSWPCGHFRFITIWDGLGTVGRMRLASEPKTTTLAPKKEQLLTAISKAVRRLKGANAFGNGRIGELPAAKMMGVIFSGLRIRAA